MDIQELEVTKFWGLHPWVYYLSKWIFSQKSNSKLLDHESHSKQKLKGKGRKKDFFQKY